MRSGLRIGIVNDLALAVEALRRALAQRPAHRVVWTAANGEQAVRLCARDTPDLILMDLMMPVMDGVEATRQIMAASPCAVLVVTASVGAQAPRVFEAMGHGAIDAADVPSLGPDGEDGVAELLAKIDVVERLIATPRRSTVTRRLVARPAGARALVAIGASAGGPAAVSRLLAGLPSSFPAAIVVIQHIDEKFADSMAHWLARYSSNPVRLAHAGERPVAGTVLLAATNEHLVLTAQQTLAYTREPVEESYRPSVNVFFDSAGASWPGPVVGVLLTGMGRDGAAGLLRLRRRGHHTIAQDQASSAVYGMPKAAAELEAAVEVLPLDAIAARVAALCAPPAPAILLSDSRKRSP